ncbi:MAG: sensor histidine kinase [Bryobacteraceae bacterium]
MALAVSTVALPVVLLLSSWRTFRELEEQRLVYLQSRAATLAGRLETLPPQSAEGEILDRLAEEEPGLVDFAIVDRVQQDTRLEEIWSGRRLYLAELTQHGGEDLFRVWIPFHSAGRLRIARFDLALSSADFLLVHARHNLSLSMVGGVALTVLALAMVWTMRRLARLEQRHLEMEHLAHIGKMSAALAHEIRNPLGTIKGFAQLAAERLGREGSPLVEPILSQTARLETLVTELLRYGRAPQPHVRTVRWSEITHSMRAHTAQWLREGRVQFSLDDQDTALRTDPQLLEEALLNLMRNSVESIPDGAIGSVRLSAHFDPASGVTISLADDGAGIPEQMRGRLFEPFVTSKASGTGLGLSITRKLVRALGGEIELSPATPRGTVATLRFPAAILEPA